MKQKGICMKRIIYIVTACAFLSVSTAKAQQVLTLKECLEEGLQNNYSLRIVHNEEQINVRECRILPYIGFLCRIYRKPG